MGFRKVVLGMVGLFAIVAVAEAQVVKRGPAERGASEALEFRDLRLERVLVVGNTQDLISSYQLSIDIRNKTDKEARSLAVGVEIKTAGGLVKGFAGFEIEKPIGPKGRLRWSKVIAEVGEIDATDVLIVRELANLAGRREFDSSSAVSSASDAVCDAHCNICQDRAEELCIDGVLSWECGCNPSYCRFKCKIPKI